MDSQNCWNELRKARENFERCLKKDNELREEWRRTTDEKRRQEIEDESSKLPFRELLDKYFEIGIKCFTK